MMVLQTISASVMLRLLFSLFILCSCDYLYGQKYNLGKSVIQFYSDATIEDIKASNTKASSIFNIDTREVVFSIPIKDFEFEKSLMKEHFNEKYLESHKYPKSIFQGKLEDVNKDFLDEQPVRAIGRLTIHGVTKEVNLPGTIEKRGNRIIARSKFIIHLDDYNVEIPKLLWQNIAEDVEVTVEFIYKPL